jgi:hypothetical protein
MLNLLGRAFLLPVLVTLGACSDMAHDPVIPGTPTPAGAAGSPSPQTLILSERWNIADVEADFPGLFSFDTTQAGANATYYVAPEDGGELAYIGEVTFCRDHFKPIYLWWDAGYGLMSFHLEPPLLFVGYRPGTHTSQRGLVFRKAVYETIQPSEATDPGGNVWQFHGRFNALCRGGEVEIGPLVFGGQILVSQDPVTHPVLVRRGSGSDGGCNGDQGGDEWYWMESYDPYSPSPEDGGQATTASCGGTDGGDGFDPSDFSCTWDYITIEISYDGGRTWDAWWSGWAQVCEESAS